MNKIAEYALYRGDEFVCWGTIAEISKFTGSTINTLRIYQSKSYQTKYPDGYLLIRLEDEDEIP